MKKLGFKKVRIAGVIGIMGLLTIASCSKKMECEIDTTLTVESSEITEVDTNQHKTYTDIVINASASKVWEVLTDFENMPNWSTSFKGMTGDIQNGGSVVVTFDIGMGDTEIPHTLIYEEGVEFGWSEPLTGLAPGISDNHRYRVVAISDCQTRFIQSDEFTGNDPVFTTSALANQVKVSYTSFNQELKAEVEK